MPKFAKRQSATYTTREFKTDPDSGRRIQVIHRHPLPMTRGKALIEARKLVPNAHVQVRGTVCCILSKVGGQLLADGINSWGDAITRLRRLMEYKPNAAGEQERRVELVSRDLILSVPAAEPAEVLA